MEDLFDYQEDMSMRICSALAARQSVMAQMPSGTGKTRVMAAVVEWWMQTHSGSAVWIVAHRHELVGQIKETLSRNGVAVPGGAKVVSIQWLSRHFKSEGEGPGLIVVDEAHHACADTYSDVLAAYPDAVRLGLTATPCRLDGKGFATLFGTLLCSWSMERFMAEGRLSLYDYYCAVAGGADQRIVDSLCKRGADGDYQQQEMSSALDSYSPIARLCQSVKRYAKGMKGIVYAVSVRHAEHIAEFYLQNGIRAAAVSSKTPAASRAAEIARFKAGRIDVLVNVDLFSEGFDCPDVEFVQLARPTLSLARYIQMVGRGLRVANGKEYCVVLDNVGLCRRFGLPSDWRDWQAMFLGGRVFESELQGLRLYAYGNEAGGGKPYAGGELELVASHEAQRSALEEDAGYVVFVSGNGLCGVNDKQGRVVVESKYREVELAGGAFACCTPSATPWADLRSGQWFDSRPRSVRLLGIEFSTCDGKKFYPRIRSRFLNADTFITFKSLALQVGSCLRWKSRCIPFDNPRKVYLCVQTTGMARLYRRDDGRLAAQENAGSPLVPVESAYGMRAICRQWEEGRKAMQRERAALARPSERRFPYSVGKGLPATAEGGSVELAFVKQDGGRKCFWTDLLAGRAYADKPRLFSRGYVRLLDDGGWCYVRNIPDIKDIPFRDWQVVADGNLCLVDGQFLFVKGFPRLWLKVFRHTDDFSYFSVKEYRERRADYASLPEILVTQLEGEGLRMTSCGHEYCPQVAVSRRPRMGWPL